MNPLFDAWLAAAADALPADLPFRATRMAALRTLRDPAFRQSQRERYRHVPLRAYLDAYSVQPHRFQAAVVPPPVGPLPYGRGAHTATFVDGVWAPERSTLGPLHPTVRLRPLRALAPAEQAEIADRCLPDPGRSADFLTLLQAALAQEAYLLEIPPHAHVEAPIVVQHLSTGIHPHLAPQLIATAGTLSRATLVEQWSGPGARVAHPWVHVALAEGANLTYHTLHTQPTPCCHLYRLRCVQQADSTFVHHAFSFGPALLRFNATVHVWGPRASTSLYGLYAPNGQEKIDQRLRVVHHSPASCSTQHYKGMVGQQATGTFHGKIDVASEAQQTNAYQTNRAILLSEAAQHYTQPQLEIYADAVKCSHGATVGQLNPEHIFYLRSKGIDPLEARRLLLDAFAEEIVGTVASAEVRTEVKESFLARLHDLLQ